MKTYQVIEPSELDGVIATWQSRLRLQDWDIRARIVPLAEVTAGKRGEIDYESQLQDAVMRILGPSDTDADMETTIVHELLHLKFCVFDRYVEKTPLAEVPLEFAIDSIARALVSAARGSHLTPVL